MSDHFQAIEEQHSLKVLQRTEGVSFPVDEATFLQIKD